MSPRILSQTRFSKPAAGWEWPQEPAVVTYRTGAVLTAPAGESVRLGGPGVHTRNGDEIEIAFRPMEPGGGSLRFGFSGGMEHATVELDFSRGRATLRTSDWTRPQPEASAAFDLARRSEHVLRIEKAEEGGRLVRMADITVYLDGRKVLCKPGVNVLPELGVDIGVTGTRVRLGRFVHRGAPSGIPEHLHVGGWPVPNRPSIERNVQSICRGLREAADAGVRLLVTPETCLTGLFPRNRVTKDPRAVAAAERRVRRFMKRLKDAPHLVMGLPVWEKTPGHRRKETRYNVSRLYAPDGAVLGTYAKIHSCETDFWHGYRLNEFNVCGVPVCMHVCHDGRYPDVWTLPVMFGARLVLHPANGGHPKCSIDAMEALARRSTSTSHAFHVHVSGMGGGWIAGPQKFKNILAMSSECRRDVPSFPMVGEPEEKLFHAALRIHDAFGYWPMRSFRASEEVARAQLELYRSMGGSRWPRLCRDGASGAESGTR